MPFPSRREKIFLVLLVIALGVSLLGLRYSSGLEAHKFMEDETAFKEVVVWSPVYADEQELVQNYQLRNPGSSFRVISVFEEDLIYKLNAFITADLTLPDIISSRNESLLSNQEIFLNLKNPPFSLEEDQLFASPEDEDNDTGTTVSRSPGFMALLYRRDLANRYLQTDKPGEIAERLSDWDEFAAMAGRLSAESSGNVYALSSSDRIWEILSYQKMPLVKIQELRTLFADHPEYVMGKRSGSFDDIDNYNRGNVLFFPVYNWEIRFNIRVFDRDLVERWDVVPLPGPRFRGSDLRYAILSSSRNPEEAWNYLSWVCLSREGSVFLMNSLFTLPANKAYYENLVWNDLPDLGMISLRDAWESIVLDALERTR